VNLKRILLVTAVTAAIVAVTAGSAGSQVVQDQWSGRWRFTADGGNTYGILKLRLEKDDDKTLHGRYTGETNGRLEATLKRKFGTNACGSFVDESGRNNNKGKFCMTLEGPDYEEFHGWYKPCRVLCFRQSWSGKKL
jgi:hypothetical protein